MSVGQALDVNERTLKAIYKAVPRDTTAGQVMRMPWSPERNLALRRVLGVAFPSDDIVTVNQGDVIQCVHKAKARAEATVNILRADLPGWQVEAQRRPDRMWLVTGYRED